MFDDVMGGESLYIGAHGVAGLSGCSRLPLCTFPRLFFKLILIDGVVFPTNRYYIWGVAMVPRLTEKGEPMDIDTIDQILAGLSIVLLTVSVMGAIFGAYVMCRREWGAK